MLASIAARARSLLPGRRDARRDAIAGLPAAISSVPDGMAASVLAGVNPIHGLYACVAGPVAGGLTAGTQRMMITTTSAAALAAGSALQGVPAGQRDDAVLLLTLLAGLVMVGAGIARLGRYTRFVSHSVMMGFLTGVAVNIVLGQIPHLLGAPADGDTAIEKALHVLTHPGGVELSSAACGASAILILLGLARTPLRPVGALFALAMPTLAIVLLGVDSVAQVSDIGAIPAGLPSPALPNLGTLNADLAIGAFSIAAIVLVQGAGVRQSAPNLDASRSRINTDFIAQGVGNLAAGLLRGQPVGGSVGTTALSVAAGARTRWAAIFAGAWMAVILIAFSGQIGKVVLPTLAAILIFAGVGSIRHGQLVTIARAGGVGRVAVVTTFVATLALPIAAAVGVGVALSLVLQLNQEASDLRVVSLVPTDDGGLREGPAPTALQPRSVALLEIYGSLLFAGARTLEARLPDVADATRAAVVLRLRGRVNLGTTFLVVVLEYQEQLAAAGGRLFLSGVDASLLDQLRRARAADVEGAGIQAFVATEVLGESTLDGYRAAQAWASEVSPDAEPASGC
ncbi:SulP family inorganic anion transporter [Capillimicrobium parvum]|uniref:Sulfate transporter n=1 Tax=Capillimicrobium parvum TaxID=2884022 RepID=A0A9E6XYD3_9ACTN|nr:SulP family inorganic anion transporter [Capillimicrobium parvum]UGS36774.1 putative sulfate transporter [Capillimicrobium parvum]